MRLRQSKKLGIMASYLMIIVNSVTSIVMVPLYIKYLGIDGYGFYQMIYSIASYILILDFGISTTMVRFITEYRTKKNKQGEENFTAHCAILVAVICIFIIIVGIIIQTNLGNIYPKLTDAKIALGSKMFTLSIVVLVLTVVEHFFEGIALANEQFAMAKMISILKIVLKSLICLALLIGNIGVISLVFADVISIVVSLVLFILYDFGALKYKVKFHYFDKTLIFPMSTFMFAIMLQSIVSYLNNTVDKTILGIMLGETASGLYGLSMTFITLFNMFPTAILTIFLPHATRTVLEGNDMERQTNMAIALGRYQMVVCGGIISAFIILGQDFIKMWSGEGYRMVWMIALIIIIPNAVPLIENYCLNVLDAMNKRLFRSLILLGISALNVVLTVMMIQWWGIIGAPISTAISYVIGHGFVMNYYYHHNIGINILKMWKGILNRLLICLIIITVVTIPIYKMPCLSWGIFGLKAIIWGIVFCGCMYTIGLNKNEKTIIKGIVKGKKDEYKNNNITSSD